MQAAREESEVLEARPKVRSNYSVMNTPLPYHPITVSPFKYMQISCQ